MTADLQSVRLRVFSLLSNALVDGRLQDELRAIPLVMLAPQEVEEARLELAELLTEASADGRLATALTDLKLSRADAGDLPCQVAEILSTAVEEASFCQVQFGKALAPRKSKVDREDARCELAGLLAQSSEDGRLASALRAVKQKNAKPDSDVGGATLDGRLKMNLKAPSSLVIDATRDELDGTSKLSDVDDLRCQAVKTLAQAANDGRLEAVLRTAQVGTVENEKDALRQETADLFSCAACDGRLEVAIREVQSAKRNLSWTEMKTCKSVCNPPSSAVEEVRFQLADTLSRAAADGSLTDALCGVKQSNRAVADVENARIELAELFARTSADGSLESALVDMRKSKVAPQAVADRATEDTTDQARFQLVDLLSRTSVDGRLAASLCEVKRLNEANVNHVGSEVSVISEAASSYVEQARIELAELFARTAADGSLKSALVDVGKSKAVSHALADRATEDTTDQVQFQLADLLSRTSADGHLAAALCEVRQSNVAKAADVGAEVSVSANGSLQSPMDIKKCKVMSQAPTDRATEDLSLGHSYLANASHEVKPSIDASMRDLRSQMVSRVPIQLPHSPNAHSDHISPVPSAFRRRYVTRSRGARKLGPLLPAPTCFRMDCDDSEEISKSKVRESSLARGYEALGVELHSWTDDQLVVSAMALDLDAPAEMLKTRQTPWLKQRGSLRASSIGVVPLFPTTNAQPAAPFWHTSKSRAMSIGANTSQKLPPLLATGIVTHQSFGLKPPTPSRHVARRPGSRGLGREEPLLDWSFAGSRLLSAGLAF